MKKSNFHDETFPLQDLYNMNACDEAYDWANEQDTTSWENLWKWCERGDWMIWFLIRVQVKEPYGRHAVLACEQGFNMANACYDLKEHMSDPRWLCASIRIYVAANRFVEYEPNLTDKCLKQCADRIRKVVPWLVVEKAIKGWQRKFRIKNRNVTKHYSESDIEELNS